MIVKINRTINICLTAQNDPYKPFDFFAGILTPKTILKRFLIIIIIQSLYIVSFLMTIQNQPPLGGLISIEGLRVFLLYFFKDLI